MKLVAMLVLTGLLAAACGRSDGSESPVTPTADAAATSTRVAELAILATAQAPTATAPAMTPEPEPTATTTTDPTATVTSPATSTSPAPTATLAPTVEPTATTAPAPDLMAALPPVTIFPSGWRQDVEQVSGYLDRETGYCNIPSLRSIMGVHDQAVSYYIDAGGYQKITVRYARVDDGRAAVEHYINNATCIEWETDEDGNGIPVVRHISPMSFPEHGGAMWARSGWERDEDGTEYGLMLVLFNVGDTLVLIANQTEYTPYPIHMEDAAEYIVDALTP